MKINNGIPEHQSMDDAIGAVICLYTIDRYIVTSSNIITKH